MTRFASHAFTDAYVAALRARQQELSDRSPPACATVAAERGGATLPRRLSPAKALGGANFTDILSKLIDRPEIEE